MAARVRIYVIEGFDYDGEMDVNYYEDTYPKRRMDMMLYGQGVLGEEAFELECLSKRYERCPSEALAAKVRAQRQIVEDLVYG